MTKKFLCILFTMILIGSLCIMPSFAADESTGDVSEAADYIIPAGEYRLNDTLTDFSHLLVNNGDTSYYFDFVSDGSSFTAFYFTNSSSYSGLVFRYRTPTGSANPYIYKNEVGYINDYYRDFTVISDTSVSSEAFYTWFFENVTYDKPEAPSALEYILSIFISVGSFISSGVSSLIPMFYYDSSLTVLGVILVSSMAISVVFLLINIVVGFLRFSR